MRFFTYLAIAGLSIVASTTPTKQKGPEKLLEVKLTPQKGSIVKVSVKNVGKKKLDLFQRGNLLDVNPTHKLSVQSSSGISPEFIGVHPRVRQDGTLHKDSFKTLKKGQSVDYTMDAAALYDLSAGGTFKITAEGVLPYSQPGKKMISGDVAYKSNTLSLKVNGTEAAHAKRELVSRNLMQPDCSQGRWAATSNALAVCSNLAFVAGEQALHGNVDQFVRYFRTADPNFRRIVSERFHAVADECGARSNKGKTFCTDQRRLCRSDYISYTLGTEITNCDLYWSFPLVTAQCHGFSQATTTIHEMTHIEGLYNPSTDDFPGHYGWPGLTTLPPEQAIMNGDNYGFYANAIYSGDVNC